MAKRRGRRSRKCPKTRRTGGRSIRAAKACLARRKPGRPSKADRKVYAKAIKRLGGKAAARKYLASIK